MDQTATLEEVREYFDHWRSHKTGRAKIPQPLWDAATDLTNRYSIGEITRCLGLNTTQFKQEMALRNTNNDSGFVDITALVDPQPPIVLEFTRKDGAQAKCYCSDLTQMHNTLDWFLAC